MRRIGICAIAFVLALGATLRAGDDKGFKPLFNGKDMKGWKFLLKDDKADPAKTFAVKDGEIQVTGDPYGYFYTDKSYKSYVLRYSWMFPKEQPDKTTMNTGLLVHIQEPQKIWPKSVEPQGRYKDHGKIYFPGWAKDDKAPKETTFDEEAQKKALKASHEWNTTETICKADGSIEVRINGTLVAKGKTELTSGPIGFQSEGARIHFKDIKIKMLDDGKKPAKTSEVVPPAKIKEAPAPVAQPPKDLPPPPEATPVQPATQPQAEPFTPRRGILANLRARLRGR